MSIDSLPPPPGAKQRRVDLLPAPPVSTPTSSIAHLPPPPMSAAVAALPPPPSQSSPLVSARTPVPPSASTPPSAESLDKEIADRGAFDKPAVSSEPITDAELEVLAKKHNVKSSVLRAGLTSFGGATENKSDFLDKVGSLFNVASAGAGFDVPTKLAKKAMPDNYERAFDDLQDLASGRKSYAVKTAETAAGVLTGGAAIKGARTLWQVAKPMAAFGAAAGFGGSRKGEEIQGTAIGGSIGGVLGVAGHVAVPVIGKAVTTVTNLAKRGMSGVEAKLFDKGVKEGTHDIAGAIRREAERTAKSSEILESSLNSNNFEPAANEVDRILSEQLSTEAVEAALTPGTAQNMKLMRKAKAARVREMSPDIPGKVAVEEVAGDEIKTQLAKEVLEDNTIKFAKYLAPKAEVNSVDTALEAIQSWTSKEGGLTAEGAQKALKAQYDIFTMIKHGLSGIDNEGIEIQGTGNFLGKALHGAIPKEQSFRIIDAKAGTGAESLLEKYNTDLAKMSTAKNYFKKKSLKLSNESNQLGITPEASARIYHAIENGELDTLSAAERKAADAHMKIVNEGRDYVNGVANESGISLPEGTAPIHIGELAATGDKKGYVYKTLLDTDEAINAIRKQSQSALEEVANARHIVQDSREILSFADLSAAEFKDALQLKSVRDLMWPLHSLSGSPITRGVEVDNALRALNSRTSRSSLETVARAAQSRTGMIPDYLLEKNLVKLQNKYLDNSLQHVYLRDVESKLRAQATLLAAAGDKAGAQSILNSILGVRGTQSNSLPAAFRQNMAATNIHFDRMAEKYGADTVLGKTALLAKGFPSLLHDINLQIYPNTMGWSVRSAVQNQLQTLTKTYPELGAIYGVKNLKTAIFNVVFNRKSYLDRASNWGLLQAEHIAGMEESIAAAIDKSTSWKLPRKILASYTKYAMFLQKFAEDNNRAISVAAAEKMIVDLRSGTSSLAMGSLRKMPPEVQATVTALLQSNPLKAEEMLARHLIAQTQYFYSKASMSDFGHMLGPMFTPFTRWPTGTAGDFAAELSTKKLTPAALRLAEKYMVPFMLMGGLQHLIFGDPDKMSDAQRLIAGSSGLTGAAPITVLRSLYTGEVGSPPMLRILKKGIIDPALRGDTNKAEQGFNQLFQTFTPAAGLYRFLYKDLDTFLSAPQYTKMK